MNGFCGIYLARDAYSFSQKGAESILETSLFGKYRLISQLGKGSSSRVYLAEHTKLKAFRAIKCISKSQRANPQFYLEINILKNLKHPGIPTIYDIEEDEESYYIIEEYIQGKSLEAFMLCQDCIPIDTILYIMMQICEVLQYLHRQEPNPIIYQDLKPEHILLCGNRIVLVDFGIASYINCGNTFQNFGTEGYAPPEKYQGISCDARTDIYGIGKVLEYLMEKMPPLEYPILQPIMQKALEPSMERRFQTVESMMEELEKCAQDGIQNIHPQQNSKHLLNIIAIAGTQSRVGTTHIGIALSCYFNEKKRPCIYQECHKSESMRELAREAGGVFYPDGRIIYGRFQGMPYYGEGIEKQDLQSGLAIQDYGTNYQEAPEDSPLVLVMGGRLWEIGNARKALDHISLRDNLVILCNYGDSVQAKKIAKEYRHRIYCFPLDENPFHLTSEKRKLFQKLLKQEGW